VVVFPQGTLIPNDRRPLRLYSGLARLAQRVGQVQLVPVAFRYEFLQEQRPDAFASIGPPRLLTPATPIHPRALTTELTAALTAEVDALHADITAEQFAGFTTILRGKQGIDRIFDALASRGRRESRRLTMERTPSR
jgi:1-acyl-sn-glycerol-3-phosphate acyltransferase